MSDREFILQEIRKIFKEQDKMQDPEDSSSSSMDFAEVPTRGPTVTIGEILKGNIPDSHAAWKRKISPGMDAGEKGDCKYINKAAIDVEPKLEDPIFIYKVLVNAGVVDESEPAGEKPCDILNKHVANFQKGAIKGTLNYQDKRDRKSISDLFYNPAVKTVDFAPNIKMSPEKVASKPGPVTENEKLIAVDGKIGSRTAKLFKIFNDSPPPVVPKEPEPKKTSTTTSKKTSSNRCNIQFRNRRALYSSGASSASGAHFADSAIEDLKLQVVQTVRGVSCENLSHMSKADIFNGFPNDFVKLSQTLSTADSGSDFNIEHYKSRIAGYKDSIFNDFENVNKQYMPLNPKAKAGEEKVGKWNPKTVESRLFRRVLRQTFGSSPYLVDIFGGLYLTGPYKSIVFGMISFKKLAKHISKRSPLAAEKILNYYGEVTPFCYRSSSSNAKQFEAFIKFMNEFSLVDDKMFQGNQDEKGYADKVFRAFVKSTLQIDRHRLNKSGNNGNIIKDSLQKQLKINANHCIVFFKEGLRKNLYKSAKSGSTGSDSKMKEYPGLKGVSSEIQKSRDIIVTHVKQLKGLDNAIDQFSREPSKGNLMNIAKFGGAIDAKFRLLYNLGYED